MLLREGESNSAEALSNPVAHAGQPDKGHRATLADAGQVMSPASEAPKQVTSPTRVASAEGKTAPCKPVVPPSLEPVKPEIEEGLQELPVSVPAVVLDQAEATHKAPAVPEMNIAPAGAPAASIGNGSISHHGVQQHHAENPASKPPAEGHRSADPGDKNAAAVHPQKAEPSINKHADHKQKPLGASEKAGSPAHAAALPTESITGSKQLQHDHQPVSQKQDAPTGERTATTAASTAGAWLNSHSPGKKVDKASSSIGAPAVAKAQTPSKPTQHEQDADKAQAPPPSITAQAAEEAGGQAAQPVFQASAASATAKKRETGSQPVAAALEPSKVSMYVHWDLHACAFFCV